MSGRSYPRIGRTSLQRKWEKLPAKAAPKCSACSQPARFRVDIEVNWFRGDDECGRACNEHKSDALALLAGIERHQAEQKALREAKEGAAS
ncbi:hypothetical protein JVX96_24505 [Variovorax sp. PDNC026]|uniref:hypothetical protein n=1 Tax=Variovorax sp. PDNC026 TaxID=2811425 RepID=UPI001964F599|nr:hypothetical protein [Variovorax sp. PDNC026]QRY31206.1 hypothetical protein JVX96_24505 [Variovorax sp. PDNC026]